MNIITHLLHIIYNFHEKEQIKQVDYNYKYS